SVLEPAPEPVPQRAPEAERRQLTAMFCDLVGSTSISERLDPEELRDILALYYERCTEVIDRFGGHISRYVGDGIDVHFGYPQAFEDSVKRAAYSGLHILRAIEKLNEDLRPRGIEFVVRIGINTGLVVVGSIGKGTAHEETAVVGDVPIVAARLQNLAEPG